MEVPTGWAEPDQIIGTPRMQKVEGFYYFYIEQTHPAPGEKEEPVANMIERVGQLFDIVWIQHPAVAK